MSKRSSYLLLVAGMVLVAVVVWGASGYMWHWLLAMHGKH